MEWLNEFLNSEKTLFLFAGIIGVISSIIRLLFLFFFNHNNFSITMVVIEVLEIVIMFPAYLKYDKKIETKILSYENNKTEFLKTEPLAIQKALKSFFNLKLIYGFLIVILILTMSFLSSKSILFGVFTALILHLAFAITIDNFGEKYTQKYLLEVSAQK